MEKPPSVPMQDLEWSCAFDQMLHAQMSRATLGLSPASLALAFYDWATHFAISPGKWVHLAHSGTSKWAKLTHYLPRACVGSACAPCVVPLEQDKRFRDEAWQRWPFNLYSQAFLLQQQWWLNATTSIRGVSAHHEQMVSFMARQLLDMMSPVNFLATNPLAQESTLRESGQNLLRGWRNLQEDWERISTGRPPWGAEQFIPGETVATTPGKVVFRNHLMELIQYSPRTPLVKAQPVLFIPAWIMKYYILDLSPHNSLVRYLVEHGYTVFMISWRNPGADDHNLGMDDYLRLGVLDALNIIGQVLPGCRVNALGYCLGGTLLAITAAYLAREKNPVIQSITLLAAQIDFTEAGELMLFIDESQISYLEDIMWGHGYLDAKQMAGAFQLLRSNDLIWSQLVQEYLLGQRASMTDLMAWNADSTRMPYRMHSEYLRRLFLDNDLFEGRYQVDGRPVVLHDIRTPVFVVATEIDHVAPWRSVYKIQLALDVDSHFLLTSGGHNAGIISEPGHPGRYFRLSAGGRKDRYTDPDTWLETTRSQHGSWWPVWEKWLAHQSGEPVVPPAMGCASYPARETAPGLYVMER
ncbi:poly-beta-hydroxybutyrate polymerase [Chromobacterium phragmitis]|uniref:Poly-beta-hydroxybutyrate polymerase n=1 Tax=Chromobacterium phragmitis TaxID=2202141 RepID=A0A344UNU7_9NEIS|nr:alpha/beta fold hydrolase [Chromobacterium phragmitis]AXE29133.1 poly-beta-hydroxybutyrate polymerase [Chromobacterium phragmitis]AXE36945.1 poly-beta-hydroxybutyrate polymerase [Chromobacterium phragmitis]